MSFSAKRNAPKSKGAGLALGIGVLWLLTLGAIWFAQRSGESESGGYLNFIARFHVVVIHLPIGVIFLALLMELLAFLPGLSHLRKSLSFVLWIGVLGAIGATLMGYLLMNLEGFGGRAMDFHMWFGLGVVATSLAALVFFLRGRRWLYRLCLLAASFATAASGHFGGAMVHDSHYLTEYAPEEMKPVLTAGLGTGAEEQLPHSGEGKGGPAAGEGKGDPPAEEPEEVPLGERVVYTDFVAPVLEARCNECHDANKTKGDLRMDTYELLLAGAEDSDFPTVVPGNADESELILRVTLPEDDIDIMPPEDDPLTPEEIELLTLWIDSGAGRETTVAELGDAPSIEDTVLAVAERHEEEKDPSGEEKGEVESVWDTLSPTERQERMDQVMAAARRHGFSVMPISAEDQRLRVNVINASGDFGDEQLALLEPVAERIAWLNLARSQVTDEGMETVAKMRGLERLHLENTDVSDEGIAELAGLDRLAYLNLYGTRVGNGIFETFRTMPELRKVYVWQTDVEAKKAAAYERSVNLKINTGVELAASSAKQNGGAVAGGGGGSAGEDGKPNKDPNGKTDPQPADGEKPVEKGTDRPEREPATQEKKTAEKPKTAPDPSETAKESATEEKASPNDTESVGNAPSNPEPNAEKKKEKPDPDRPPETGEKSKARAESSPGAKDEAPESAAADIGAEDEDVGRDAPPRPSDTDAGKEEA